MINIRSFSAQETTENARYLALLLKDAVDSGASLGFIPPLEMEDAASFWKQVETSVRNQQAELIVAMDEDWISGCVILALPSKPNASHRAEIQKLMVLSSERRRGIGRKLMETAEEVARKKGRTLLVLDTRKGDPASALYEATGWIRFGEVPGFARSADGRLHTTSFFYKNIG